MAIKRDSTSGEMCLNKELRKQKNKNNQNKIYKKIEKTKIKCDISFFILQQYMR